VTTAQPAADFRLSSIGQVALTTTDLDRAVAFYRDALGLKYLFSAPPGLAFFDCDGIRLMLSLPEGPDAARPGAVLYFRVQGIEEAHRTLMGRGVTFQEAPHRIARLPDHELWMAFFKDPDGNVLALMEEKR
jgi:catechol 2,3-dioxygenase-like lactoylglutathione lyase family enzyme